MVATILQNISRKSDTVYRPATTMAPLCVAVWTLVVLTHGTLTALLLCVLGTERVTAGVVGIVDSVLLEALLIWTEFGADPVLMKLRRLREKATADALRTPLQPCHV